MLGLQLQTVAHFFSRSRCVPELAVDASCAVAKRADLISWLGDDFHWGRSLLVVVALVVWLYRIQTLGVGCMGLYGAFTSESEKIAAVSPIVPQRSCTKVHPNSRNHVHLINCLITSKV